MTTSLFSSISTKVASISLLAAITTLAACSNDSNKIKNILEPTPEMMTYSYQVEVTNLTAAQPFSPVAIVLHDDGYRPYKTGMPASIGLEMLAESGSNTDFITDAEMNSDVMNTASGTGIIAPGDMETLSIDITMEKSSMAEMKLSLATMLVNTNDGFTGIDSIELNGLLTGGSMSMMLISYDAGTEANSETADTIPGPASTGGLREGYNASRNDTMDAVLAHSGVITMDDGLAASTLTVDHKWDNPVASITVTRIQ